MRKHVDTLKSLPESGVAAAGWPVDVSGGGRDWPQSDGMVGRRPWAAYVSTPPPPSLPPIHIMTWALPLL